MEDEEQQLEKPGKGVMARHGSLVIAAVLLGLLALVIVINL